MTSKAVTQVEIADTKTSEPSFERLTIEVTKTRIGLRPDVDKALDIVPCQ